ncbi:MAG: cytochrome c-type biogenesis protein CcmH [Gammaproteobacteria bacterium]|nr:cytochrome c-type biogenesis protein CcmH [Gammaproteobacteria bacterium]NNL51510.1 cytochrome c-type biogenesis protein CcmH [Woeseiaceae bacterium]
MRRFLVLAVALFSMAPVAAIDTGQAFDDPVLQARYEKLISEVRCLKCQNQSIKDSNVFLASDLRREIRRLIAEGKTDAEIGDFLVTRYGEFALYRPRTTGKTLVLWIAPFLLVLFGGFAMFRIVRHRVSIPIDDDSAKTAKEESFE